MDLSGLEGSSADKPWHLSSNGVLVLSRSPLRGRENRGLLAGPSRMESSICQARVDAVSAPTTRPLRKTLKRVDINRMPSPGWEFRPPVHQVPSAAATRVVRRGALVFPGKRETREEPLVQEDLYLTDARPPNLIVNDYPTWSDKSKVTISWDGLEFPVRRRRRVYDDGL
ncbi:hypothetical protein C8R43DRAFT_965951 [Mycena crocata]|nr:hypothetical protein C8R43DRAFT_965951 [Mycena crocata]